MAFSWSMKLPVNPSYIDRLTQQLVRMIGTHPTEGNVQPSLDAVANTLALEDRPVLNAPGRDSFTRIPS